MNERIIDFNSRILDALGLTGASYLYLKQSGLLKRDGKFLSTLYTWLVFISDVFDASGSVVSSFAEWSSIFPFVFMFVLNECWDIMRVVAINTVTRWRNETPLRFVFSQRCCCKVNSNKRNIYTKKVRYLDILVLFWYASSKYQIKIS